MSAPRITPASWAMIAVLGVTWGSTFLVTELGLEGLTPFWLAAARIVLASLVMGLVWGLRGGALFAAPAPARSWAALLAVGAFSTAIPFCLLAWGQQFVTAGFAGVSMASVALIVLPLSHLFVAGERMTPARVLGVLIGFAGVCVLIGGAALDTTGAALETAGRMACIGAACCYGVSSVLMRRLPAIDPIGLASVILIIAAALTLPVALAVEGPPPRPDARTAWIIAFLGLVPTAAANVLRVTVIRTAGPVFMSLTNYQVPLWSVLLGAWILDEPLPRALLVSMAMILGGVALSQWAALRALFRRGTG